MATLKTKVINWKKLVADAGLWKYSDVPVRYNPPDETLPTHRHVSILYCFYGKLVEKSLENIISGKSMCIIILLEKMHKN